MPQQILLRRGLATQWTAANTVLEPGELGVETDTGKIKVGNTAGDAWNDLPYSNPDIPAIPANLSDLDDVSSTAPTTGQVLKWDGTQWAPGTDSGGTGSGATLLDELTDVTITDPVAGEVLEYNGASWVNTENTLDNLSNVVVGGGLATGQVLKYDGTNWTNAAEAAETPQVLSVAQATTTPRIALSGGGTSVGFAPGNANITFTTDEVAKTVTVETDNTGYLFGVSGSASTASGLSYTPIDLGTGTQGTPTTITFRDSSTARVRKTDIAGIQVVARNTTYSNTLTPNIDGVVLNTTGKAEETGLVATLVSGQTTVTLTSGSALGLYANLSLVKTAGTGAFGTGAKIVSVDSATNSFTVDVAHATSGEVTFNAQYVYNVQFQGDVGMTVTEPQDGVILFTPTSRVGTGTVNRLAQYSDPANLNAVYPTNAGLEYDNTNRYFIITSGRAALRQTDLQMIHDAYGTGSRTDGLQYAMYFDNALSRAWNFIRARGTSTAPQPVQVGDELFQIRSYAQFNTNTTGVSIGTNIRSVVVNVGTNQVGSDLRFSTSNGTTAASVRLKITHDGVIQMNNLQAFTTNGDLNILTNGTGYVRLPTNTTVGGVPLGSISLSGTKTDAQLTALTGMATGDAYVCSSTGGAFTAQHIYLWDGSAWNDLGSFQGPAGNDGADGTDGSAATIAVGTVTTGAAGSSATVTNVGDSTTAVFNFAIPRGDKGDAGDAATIAVGTVTTGGPGSSATVTNSGTSSAAVFDFSIPTGNDGAGVVAGGTAGQVLAKIDADDYNTEWITPFDGAYASLTGAPTIPADIGDLTDTGGLLFDGAYASLTGAPTLAAVATSGSYTDLTDQPTIPAALTDLGITDGTPGQVLTTDGSGTFTFTTVSSGGATTLDGLSDVDTSGAVTGSVLKFDGTNWVVGTDNNSGSGGIALTDLSVGAEGTASGDGGMSYDNTTGVFTYTPPVIPAALTDLGITDGTSGQVLTTDGAGNFSFTTVSGGGGGTLAARGTVSGSTSSLADGATGPINLTGFHSYMLMKVQTSAAAWVRIYSSEAARIADASRTEGTDPAPGAGIIAEVITTGAQTVLISPGALGFNDESPVTTNIPVRVTNNSGSTAVITVTLTLLQLEA